MLTADTITDEQIRELRDSSQLLVDIEDKWWRDNRHKTGKNGEREHLLRVRDLRQPVSICDSALNPKDFRHHEARARCAAILNAQSAPNIFDDLFPDSLTADTVTDEAIRTYLLHHGDVDTRIAARLALGAMNETRRRESRARCAELLNARENANAKGPK